MQEVLHAQDSLYYPIDRAISLIKIDSTGDTLFIRYFDGDIRGGITSIDGDIKGNIYCAISLFPNYPANNNYRTVITKHNTSGDILWQKRFNQNVPTWVSKIIALPDGGAILSSSRSDFGSTIDMYAIRVDSNGNELWNTTYYKGGFEFGQYMELLADGSILLSGYRHVGTRREPYLLQIDQDGNKLQ